MNAFLGILYGEWTRTRNIVYACAGLVPLLLINGVLPKYSPMTTEAYSYIYFLVDLYGMFIVVISFVLGIYALIRIAVSLDVRGSIAVSQSVFEQVLPSSAISSGLVRWFYRTLVSVAIFLAWAAAAGVEVHKELLINPFFAIAILMVWVGSFHALNLTSSRVRRTFMLTFVALSIGWWGFVGNGLEAFLFPFLGTMHLVLFFAVERARAPEGWSLWRAGLGFQGLLAMLPRSRASALVWVQSTWAECMLLPLALLFGIGSAMVPTVDMLFAVFCYTSMFFLGYFWERNCIARSLVLPAMPITPVSAGLARAAFALLISAGVALLYVAPTAMFLLAKGSPPTNEVLTVFGTWHDARKIDASVYGRPSWPLLGYWCHFCANMALTLWASFMLGRLLMFIALVAFVPISLLMIFAYSIDKDAAGFAGTVAFVLALAMLLGYSVLRSRKSRPTLRRLLPFLACVFLLLLPAMSVYVATYAQRSSASLLFVNATPLVLIFPWICLFQGLVKVRGIALLLAAALTTGAMAFLFSTHNGFPGNLYRAVVTEGVLPSVAVVCCVLWPILWIEERVHG